MECRDDNEWTKICTMMKVEGTKPRGPPRKIWWDGFKEDMKRFGLYYKEDAQSWGKLRRKIKRASS